MKPIKVVLYYYSEHDKEFVFDMSCKIIDEKIHYSILDEMQRCNEYGLTTKLVYEY